MIGGADRDRTDDLYVANVALSQLSYSPADVVSPGGGSKTQTNQTVSDINRFSICGCKPIIYQFFSYLRPTFSYQL